MYLVKVGALTIGRIGRQHFEDLLPCTALRPARKSRMNLDWIAKTFRQVAPRYVCAIMVKYRLDEQPVTLGRNAAPL